MFKLEIRTGGSAYRDEFSEEDKLDPYNTELIRNLKGIINRLQKGYDYGYVMDINGNKTGEWKLED